MQSKEVPDQAGQISVVVQPTAPLEADLYEDELRLSPSEPLPPPIMVLPSAVAILEECDELPPPVIYDYQNGECLSQSFARQDPSEGFLGNTLLQQNGDDQEVVNPRRKKMFASGLASAVVGTLLMGPVVGTLAGFGSAYATRKEGVAGDTARAMGEIALVTREQAVLLNRKHQITKRGKQLLAQAWKHAKDLDRRHLISRKVKDFSLFSWSITVDFIRRHKLLERGGMEGVQHSASATVRRIEYIETATADDEEAGLNAETPGPPDRELPPALPTGWLVLL